ncbi:hypothetical protein AN958_05298 [Leucoagaricus sp. SymC.cos]|nr:hypothetical protein AN958_05298 [Leucoagaricus sp. SymC.cos]
MFFKALAFFALAASPALATVFLTSPVASSTFHGNQQATISWQDDGSAPSLQDFGNAMVSIYVGNAQQQVQLQLIVPGVNVATTSSIQFTPDPSIGPNSNEYFVRIESLAAKDPKNPQFPAEAFSAKFTMDNMGGTFNSTVQALIAGQSTAPLAGQTTSPTASASSSVSLSSPASRSSSSGSSSAKPSPSNNAALHSKAGWAGVLLSALVGVVAF